jgi:hypothetical protein
MPNRFYRDDEEPARGFCDHCHGQRFDRARILRTLRQLRANLRATDRRPGADDALTLALETVRALEIPHLDFEEEDTGVVH